MANQSKSTYNSEAIAIEISQEVEKLYKLGLNRAKSGQHEEAIAAFEEALKINPTYDWALNGKGIALNNLGRNTEASEVFDRALEIKPKFHLAWNGKGIALNHLGCNTEALAAFDRALKLNPNSNLPGTGKAFA